MKNVIIFIRGHDCTAQEEGGLILCGSKDQYGNTHYNTIQPTMSAARSYLGY